MSVPPGASYQASNTYVKIKRHVLQLESPVRIQFKQEWEWGNPLHDWYRRRGLHRITTMQLRRQDNAPFFHQHVAFEVSDHHYFRIDRRQLPDEATPLDYIYEQGVEAYDTIEEISSLDDESYSPSEALVELYFRERISLELVLTIFWAIHRHPSARVDKNFLSGLASSYFKWEREKSEDPFTPKFQTWLSVNGFRYDWPEYSRMNIRPRSRRTSWLRLLIIGRYGQEISNIILLTRTVWDGSNHREIWGSDIAVPEALSSYLDELIMSHSIRVEQYGRWLKCTRYEVYSDISKTRGEILTIVKGLSTSGLDDKNRLISKQVRIYASQSGSRRRQYLAKFINASDITRLPLRARSPRTRS